MRIFKDLELVEHLGSGIPRITQFFPGVRLLRFLGQRVRGILYHGIHHQRLPYQNVPEVR